jgi:hypothetical protein
MERQRAQPHATRGRRLVSLWLWLVAAGAAAVVGLDPEDVVRA